MSSRSWQILAAAVSFAILGFVVFRYITNPPPVPPSLGQIDPGSGSAPLTPTGSANEPHAGAQHHTADKPPHEGGALAPIQVFANSKVGDWQAYRITTESSIAPTFHASGIIRITKADDKLVSRGFTGKVEETGEVRKQQYEDRPRQSLTLDQLTTNDVGGWTIYEVAISDDVHEVGGRKFKCKKISYASNDPMFEGKRTHTDLWISDEVPAGGLVEEIEVQDMPTMHFRMTQQVIGFGDDKTTAWGTKPAGL